MSQLDMSMRAVSPGAGQLELTADQSSITLLPGTQQNVNLVFRNTGGSSFTVDVGVAGPPSQWLSLSQSSAILAPAQSTRVALTLKAPTDAPTGSYPLAITAQARDDATIKVSLDLVFEIAEPGQITVALSPTQGEGQALAEFQIRISQSGLTPLHVNLSASGDQTALNFTFNPATLQVAPNETATSRLTVSARQGLTGVDTRTYPFTVMATTSEGATAMSQTQGQFVQRRLPPQEFNVKPTRQSGPGAVSYTVHIGNPAQVATSFRLSASDAEGACRFQFEPPSLTVPAAGAAQATLTVTPIQYHSDSVDKTHNITVRAVPNEGLVAPLQADVVFVQTAIERPILSLTPSSQSASGATAFTLQISNPRSTPTQVEISPTSTDGMCELTISPTRVTIPPHGRAVARLNVRPISKLLPGESRRTCAFNVQARTVDLVEPAHVDGSLVQVPGAPIARWLALAGAAILALLVCVGLLWLGSSVLRFLGNTVPQVGALIPTPLPLVTPVPVPTDTPTLVPTQAPSNMPSPAPKPGGGGGGQPTPKPTPSATPTSNAAGTETAVAQKTQAAATETASARFSQYDGFWTNDDPNTNGITRLQISNNGSTISVRGFGKCSPTDCDWGTRSGSFTNEPFTILFDFGGGLTHRLTLTKENNKLQVVDVGSSSGTHTYFFHGLTFLPPARITLIPPVITLIRP